MQFTFLDMAGKTLFVRDDAERATWTQEEMTAELEFPRIDNKVISIGQRVFFKDPATGSHQIYEVKQAQTLEPDHYQVVTAEHICISELSDEHMDNKEVTNQTASATLQSILTGTLWSVGTVAVNPVSSVDLSRGSVWQAILEIKDNWNVYIEPRVTLSSDGSISRYLDILSTDGVSNGVRLSIDKNMLDPSVTFDDSEVVTALYGYGGTIQAATAEEEDKECNFSEITWTRTSQHPAKPYGQKYLEYPEATAEYGRNGRPRYGFYQNSDITDPETLLQKTWETLKTACKPAISIEGTVEDLYRMGYADQPLKLHDIALVEINPAGYKSQIQIIRMTVDLLDPSATTLTIGSYIPNIIYIERKTNEDATGRRGGGGGNSNKDDNSWREFRTTIEAYQDGTGMRIRSVQNDNKRQDQEIAVQEAQITVAYNKITQEVTDRRNADGVLSSTITQTAREIRQEVNNEITGVNSRITQTASQIRQEVNNEIDGVNSYISQTATAIRQEVANDVAGLEGSITVQANRITQEVTDRSNADNTLSGRITVEANRISLVVEGTGANAHIKPASIVSAINDGSSSIKISADHITLDGHTVATSLYGEDVQIGVLNCGDAYTSDLAADGDITSTGKIVATEAIGLGNYDASWKSKEVVTSVAVTYSGVKKFQLEGGTTWEHTVATEVTSGKSTIYYLGR